MTATSCCGYERALYKDDGLAVVKWLKRRARRMFDSTELQSWPLPILCLVYEMYSDERPSFADLATANFVINVATRPGDVFGTKTDSWKRPNYHCHCIVCGNAMSEGDDSSGEVVDGRADLFIQTVEKCPESALGWSDCSDCACCAECSPLFACAYVNPCPPNLSVSIRFPEHNASFTVKRITFRKHYD